MQVTQAPATPNEKRPGPGVIVLVVADEPNCDSNAACAAQAGHHSVRQPFHGGCLEPEIGTTDSYGRGDPRKRGHDFSGGRRRQSLDPAVRVHRVPDEQAALELDRFMSGGE